MLHEYALEPSLLGSWSDFRFYISQFGFDRGRLISRFPSKWKKLVFASLTQCKPVERARIEESLRRIDDRLVPKPGFTWDPARNWLANAVFEHAARPFHAIIAEANDQGHPAVIVGATLDDTLDWNSLPEHDPRRLWKAPTSKVIKRTAKEMADAIDAFMRLADRIFFIDKYFGPENHRHRIPLEEFLSRLRHRHSRKIQLHLHRPMRSHRHSAFDLKPNRQRLGGIACPFVWPSM